MAAETRRARQAVVRTLAGAMAVNVGARWEDELEEACKVYRSTGAADVARIPAPYRQLGAVGPKGMFQAIRCARGEVDFLGFTRGRGVAFDAKATRAARLGLDVVLPHQARSLLQAADLGALAGLAVLFETTRQAFFVPVRPSEAVKARDDLGVLERWAEAAANDAREIRASLRRAIGRKLEVAEVAAADLKGPKLGSLHARTLQELGLEIPHKLGWWDWLPVAARVCS